MHKKNIQSVKEQIYPIIIGIIFVIIGILLLHYFDLPIKSDNDVLNKIIDSVINFTSIIVGFIGVLVGILFSIRSSKLVTLLFRYNSRKKLKSYFKSAFICGMLLIFISIVMYARVEIALVFKDICSCISEALFIVWMFFIGNTMACCYRIINIMILILFSDDTENKLLEKYSISEQEKKELNDKYKR